MLTSLHKKDGWDAFFVRGHGGNLRGGKAMIMSLTKWSSTKNILKVFASSALRPLMSSYYYAQ